ncbi:hypothetical protein SAMN05216480_1195 [Pustulibacterium marinum]|uniref:Uncharacterized protein n=1 Tax=Pustulibacterium marinum TaxID=1224947 RepID=A0A1I7IPM6_9FLAO|nr:hypothetical protein [Pustulibacterium marinum]SFU74847.1 hypothetical protein SAMN05216480_1195 [Pustulibacterium marinum]
MKKSLVILIICLGGTLGSYTQEITYDYDFFNRSIKQNGVPLSLRTLDSITAKVPQAHVSIQKARHRNTWSTLLNIAAAGCIAYPAIQEIGGHDAHWEVGYVGVGLMAMNFPIILSREKHLKTGITTYNKNFSSMTEARKPHFYWGFQNYQLGVAITF